MAPGFGVASRPMETTCTAKAPSLARLGWASGNRYIGGAKQSVRRATIEREREVLTCALGFKDKILIFPYVWLFLCLGSSPFEDGMLGLAGGGGIFD